MGQAVDWLTARGSAPPGGWRVVAFAHGTLGIQGPCAPSTSDTLPLIVESLARLHPDLERDDFRQGAAKARWAVLTARRVRWAVL